jgi:phosphatidylglycerol lysyltransferase
MGDPIGEEKECEFQMVLREDVPSLLPELKTISDAWLIDKHTSEKGFSLGFLKKAT